MSAKRVTDPSYRRVESIVCKICAFWHLSLRQLYYVALCFYKSRNQNIFSFSMHINTMQYAYKCTTTTNMAAADPTIRRLFFHDTYWADTNASRKLLHYDKCGKSGVNVYLIPSSPKRRRKNHSKSRTYFLFNHSYPMRTIFINIADIKSEILLCCGSNYTTQKTDLFCAICWSWFLACNMSRFCCFDSEQLLISMVINRPRKPLKNMYHALLCSSLCLLLQVVETQFIFQRFLFRCIS